MEFYKSNTHRRLISSCLNFHYFRVFLNLPKDDGVKRNIQSYLGETLTSSNKYSIGFHRRLFEFIKTLNKKTMNELRDEIKKRKLQKRAKINYTRNGVVNTYCARINLVEYFLRTNTKPYYYYRLSSLEQFIAFTKTEYKFYNRKIHNLINMIEDKPKQFCKEVEEDIDGF